MPEISHIGVDLDDVIVPTNEYMCIWHNRVYGTSYQVKDVVTYDLQHLWGCSDDEVLRRIHDFYETEDHAEMPLVSGAAEALTFLLCKGKPSSIITARDLHMRGPTENLVRKHIPILLDRIHYPTKMVDGVPVRMSKAEICEQEKIDLFIEDSLKHVYPVAKIGIPVYLFDRPWNQTNDLPENVTRVYSWDHVVELQL